MRNPKQMAAFALVLGAALFARAAAPSGVAPTIDRMTASGKSQREIAQYVFEAGGCKGCHTAGENGSLGFTPKGRQAGQDFEGCLRMLSSMNFVSQVPEKQRSADQRTRAAHFEEFGCTFCHQITPGKMGLTPVAQKLTYLHLSCVQAEKKSGKTAAKVASMTAADVPDCCKK